MNRVSQNEKMYVLKPCMILLAICFIVFQSKSVMSQQLTPPSYADYQKGVDPLAAYKGSELDVVNLFNGNLSVKIPLVGLPQRGGGMLELFATYNSKIWQVEKSGQSESSCEDRECEEANVELSLDGSGGWQVTTNYDYALGYKYMSDERHLRWKCLGGDQCSYVRLGRLGRELFDPDGQAHELRWSDNDTVFVDTRTPNWHHVFRRFRSVDNTYLRWLRNPEGEPDHRGILTLPNGTIMDLTSGTTTDTNGNVIDLRHPTDTLGRTILITRDAEGWDSDSEATSHREVIQTIDSSGTPQNIYIYWTQTFLNNKRYRVFSTAKRRFISIPITVPIDIIRKIELPNGLTYEFEYNSDGRGSGWGELSRMMIPTGGTISYSYTLDRRDGGELGLPAVEIARNRVQSRTINNDSDYVWSYERWPAPELNTLIRVVRPDGNTEDHYFYRDIRSAGGGPGFGTFPAVQDWIRGREFRVEFYQGLPPSRRLLKKVERIWRQNIPPGPYVGNQFNNPYVKTEYTTVYDLDGRGSAKTAIVDYSVNVNGHITEQREYDYVLDSQIARDSIGLPRGIPVAAALIRATRNEYQAHIGYHLPTAPRILDRVTRTIIYDGSERLVSDTRYEYDNYRWPMEGRSGTTGHNPSYDASYQPRGNITAISIWIDPPLEGGEAWITRYRKYDIYGNVTGESEFGAGSGPFQVDDITALKWTRFEYSNQYMSAYVTKMTSPAPFNFEMKRSYYLDTGLLRSETDANNHTTSYSYDQMNRLLSVSRPDGGRTDYFYNDVIDDLYVRETTRINANTNLARTSRFNELGRVVQTETSDPEGTVFTETQYDTLGRVWRVSAPYRTGSPQWTTNAYDALSRVTSVRTPDGAAVTTTYSGDATTVMDQAEKARRSIMDALGRLIRVDEPNASGSLGSIDDPAQPTFYKYDALGNLRIVCQGRSFNQRTEACEAGQRRIFTYDSLSRLRQATNPESGTTSFTYDANGNLRTRADSRGVTMTYDYDALNRLTSKSCSGNMEICSLTPVARYFYDDSAVVNGKGRRSKAKSENFVWEALEYDPLGRLKKERNGLEGINFLTGYKYDLAGNVTEVKYPSGKEVRYEYSNANRLLAAKDEQNSDYLSDITYGPHGGISSMAYGNNLMEARNYNNRLQLTESLIREKMHFTYNYTLRGGNNGNIYQIKDHLPGGRTYDYDYDELNRIKWAQVTDQQEQTYYYDRYGNLRKNDSDVSGWIDPATNRIRIFSYDSSGNQTSGEEGQQYKYDGENHLVKVNDGMIAEYKYDADGRRVLKIAEGKRTFFIYDRSNKMLSEFEAPATGELDPDPEPIRPGSGQVRYQHTDHLGSPRVITDQSGQITEQRDYYPFGEEMTNTENNQIKFTAKLRDAETGLDYFGARYYASASGRFLSTDPGLPNRGEPQTWNRYSYVTNNPLRYDDPDGRLKRDKNGNLKFKKLGETFREHTGAPGVKFHLQGGYLFADDGTKIEAFRSLEKRDYRIKCDCHGLAFADGKFWIDDQQVNKLLKGDHYKKTDKPQVGDVGIYRDIDGKVVHSVTVTAVDRDGKVTEVSGLGGLEPAAHSDAPEPGPNGAWYDPKAKVEYWHKEDDNRSEERRKQDVGQIKKYKKVN